MGEWPGGVSPPGSLRTVRDSLPSYGSRHPVDGNQPSSTSACPNGSSLTVGRQASPGGPSPSLQPHYRAFSTTTRRSAPVPRTGTQPLAVPAAWGSPVRDRPQARTAPLASRPVGATGSHVPCKSLSQARATSTPDAIWAVNRLPPDSSRGSKASPVSTSSSSFDTSSVVRSRSPSWLIPAALNGATFPATLTTTALDRSSSRWFAASACTAAAEGHQAQPDPAPPSPAQHRIQNLGLLHPASFNVRGTPPDDVQARRPRTGRRSLPPGRSGSLGAADADSSRSSEATRSSVLG